MKTIIRTLFFAVMFLSALLIIAITGITLLSNPRSSDIAPAKAETGDIAIDEINFPDNKFRQCVSEKDTDSNGYLSADEISAVTEIWVSNEGINGLKGIEYFTSLNVLYLNGNSLRGNLDLSQNTALKTVSCSRNQYLTSITINSAVLEKLYVDRTGITQLDLSKFPALNYLNCEYSGLSELDLRNNAALKELHCNNNDLTEIDLTENVNITKVDCSGNHLKELDLKGNESLKNLNCSNNSIKSLDLTGCVALFGLDCYDNYMEELILTGCVKLNGLNCQNNKIKELDLTSCVKLNELNCQNNEIGVLDLTDCTALETLYCAKNKLLALDVSNCSISRLDCDPQQAELAAAKNGNLWELDLSERIGPWEKVSDVAVTSGTLGADGKTVSFEGESAEVEYRYATGFGQRKMQVTLTLTHGFRITVDGGIIENSGGTSLSVEENGAVTVTAATLEGKVFEGWSLDGGETIISREPAYTFTADSDTAIKAIYSDISAPPENPEETDPDTGEKPSDPGVTAPDSDAEIVPLPSEPEGLSDKAIAGIAVGAVAGAVIIAYAVCAILFKKGIIKGAFFSKIYPFIK